MPKFPMLNRPALEFARLYKTLGWPVFPLSPRKKSPATKHGFHDASLDDKEIESWWGGENAKERFGIGIPTGRSSGLIVVDIDARNGGWGTVERLKAEGKHLPEDTVRIYTSGERHEVGCHYYFRFPGIDIKADGGYVCAPPTTHPTGSIYSHASIDKEIADLPDWVLERLKQGRSSSSKRVLDGAPAGLGLGSSVREGQRNSHLTSLAGWLRRENYPAEAIFANVWQANQSVCTPPLDQKEVRRIVESVTRYAPNPEAAVQAVEPDAPVTIKLLGGGDLWSAEVVEPDWILENRLAQGDICVVAGAPEAGKSWFAMDLAICTAAMLPIYGLPAYFGRLRTLMLDEENTLDEIKRRYNRLCIAHGLTSSESQELLQAKFRIGYQTGLNFGTAGYMEWLTEQVREFQPHTITIDSATAMSGVKDENAATDVRAFFQQKLIPIRNICNSTIIIIHHTNKMIYRDPADREVANQGLIRGSIDWLAGADSSWLLQKEGEEQPYIRLCQTKQRRGFPPGTLKIRLLDTQEGGVIPMVLNPPAQENQTRRQQGKRSKQAEGMLTILQWLTGQDADYGEVLAKKDVLDQSMLFYAGAPREQELGRKDLHNAMTMMIRRGIFTEVEEGSSQADSSEKRLVRGPLIRLTITKEQLVSRLRSYA
jgi:hypothetical protein